MRKALEELGEPYSKDVELFSFHSTSKGILGECGLRGGYFEVHNLTKRAEDLLFKLKSIELCSNTVGQAATELMINPPKKGVQSDETVELYNNEYNTIFGDLKERARMLTHYFNNMRNVTCTEIEGAMYGFPQLHFSKAFEEKAAQQGVAPDFLYCLDMVNETGIMTVPGSGFKQSPGTHHFRITNLVSPNSKMEAVLESLKKFNDKWH